jgi:hypothetical protein
MARFSRYFSRDTTTKILFNVNPYVMIDLTIAKSIYSLSDSLSLNKNNWKLNKRWSNKHNNTVFHWNCCCRYAHAINFFVSEPNNAKLIDRVNHIMRHKVMVFLFWTLKWFKSYLNRYNMIIFVPKWWQSADADISIITTLIDAVLVDYCVSLQHLAFHCLFLYEIGHCELYHGW